MIPRCNHNTIYNNGELLIFGGLNFNGYVNFDSFVIK